MDILAVKHQGGQNEKYMLHCPWFGFCDPAI